MDDPIDKAVSGAFNPLSSEELRREADAAESERHEGAAGGDTHLPASESDALGGTDAARPIAASGPVTTLPPD